MAEATEIAPRTVQDVMSTTVTTVAADEVIGPIRDTILFGGISAVPVVGDDGQVVGILTANDLVEEYAPRESVRNAMTQAVATVKPTTTLADAAKHMRERYIHHLVVERDGELVGMVSTFDLLDALIAER
ncbi:MAG: CBS domain-containing protein [Acidimicrobiia bacterium]|nr:CBS domain-containing protein [Acidimicrobiia bacterium]